MVHREQGAPRYCFESRNGTKFSLYDPRTSFQHVSGERGVCARWSFTQELCVREINELPVSSKANPPWTNYAAREGKRGEHPGTIPEWKNALPGSLTSARKNRETRLVAWVPEVFPLVQELWTRHQEVTKQEGGVRKRELYPRAFPDVCVVGNLLSASMRVYSRL